MVILDYLFGFAELQISRCSQVSKITNAAQALTSAELWVNRTLEHMEDAQAYGRSFSVFKVISLLILTLL